MPIYYTKTNLALPKDTQSALLLALLSVKEFDKKYLPDSALILLPYNCNFTQANSSRLKAMTAIPAIRP